MRQSFGVWQSAHSSPRLPLWTSSDRWQSMHADGVPVEFLVHVAGLAGGRGVQSASGKPVRSWSKRTPALPGLSPWQVPQPVPSAFLVRIVPAMARNAGGLELFSLRRTLVTGHAAKVSVGTGQGELRFLRVIEFPVVPGPRRVAGLALDPVTALMGVVAPVAIDTRLAGGLPEVIAGVAGHCRRRPAWPAVRAKPVFFSVVESRFLPRRRSEWQSWQSVPR